MVNIYIVLKKENTYTVLSPCRVMGHQGQRGQRSQDMAHVGMRSTEWEEEKNVPSVGCWDKLSRMENTWDDRDLVMKVLGL